MKIVSSKHIGTAFLCLVAVTMLIILAELMWLIAGATAPPAWEAIRALTPTLLTGVGALYVWQITQDSSKKNEIYKIQLDIEKVKIQERLRLITTFSAELDRCQRAFSPLMRDYSAMDFDTLISVLTSALSARESLRQAASALISARHVAERHAALYSRYDKSLVGLVVDINRPGISNANSENAEAQRHKEIRIDYKILVYICTKFLRPDFNIPKIGT